MKKITLLLFLLTFSFGYSQDPAAGATDPIARNAWDVKSIYNGVASPMPPQYTNEPNGDFQDFGGTTIVGPVTLADGNTVMKYTNHLYSGIRAGAGDLDVTSMTNMHIDVYSPSSNFTSFKIKLESVNAAAKEIEVPFTKVQGSWNSYDLDLSTYTGVDLAHVKWIVPVSYTPPGVTLYLDNVYFYRAATATPSPTLGAFTIPQKQPTDAPFQIVPPTSNSTGAFSYTSSNMAVATVSGDMITIVGSGVSNITANQAADVNFGAGSTSATFTVQAVPIVAAPTPPNRNTADVISLFSNAYTNITIDAWSAPWDDSSYIDLMIAGNDTKKITFGNFLGVDFSVAGHHQDLTAMTNFHMDFWTPNTDLIGKVFNTKLSQWGGGAGEVSAAELNINTGTMPAIVSGAWVSIDVPWSQWANNPNARNDIAQFLISSNLGVVYVDNIYFYKGTALGVSKFETSKIKMYPNPVSNELNIEANSTIQKVAVYNILGQEVLSSNPKSNTAKLQTSSLKNGVYFVTTTIDDVVSSSKFIKN